MVTLRKAHKCIECGVLIPAGDKAIIMPYVKEKFYPVKGIMRFTNYHYKHISC